MKGGNNMSKMEIVNIKNEKVKDINLKDNVWKTNLTMLFYIMLLF